MNRNTLSPAERNAINMADCIFKALTAPPRSTQKGANVLKRTIEHLCAGPFDESREEALGIVNEALEQCFAAETTTAVSPAEDPEKTKWVPLYKLIGPGRMDNFMYMGECEGMNLYKHINTRRYLNIDRTTGQTFQFVPADHGYIPIPQDEAIKHVFS